MQLGSNGKRTGVEKIRRQSTYRFGKDQGVVRCVKDNMTFFPEKMRVFSRHEQIEPSGNDSDF